MSDVSQMDLYAKIPVQFQGPQQCVYRFDRERLIGALVGRHSVGLRGTTLGAV